MDRRCPSCGKAVEPGSTGGRPRTYCNAVCRRLAEYELRRVQQRLLRLEVQAEVCRRGDFPDMQFLQGGTSAERARDVAAEIARTTARLRELLAAGPV